MISTLNGKQLLGLLALFATFMLTAALIAQYGFSLPPCHLCMFQRYPYAVIAAVAVIGYYFVQKPRIWWALVAVCLALLMLDAAIAFYHAGVEAGVFIGPSGCTNQATTGQSLEEMRAQIMNAPLVSCDQPMARILGLTLAAWNGIAASLMALFIAAVAFELLKRKK